jgi:protein phosphatase
MGTTLVALLWSQDHAVIANIGDSRGYQLHRANATGDARPLIQITEDHTYGNLVADASNVPSLSERIARFLDGRADGRSPDLTARILRAGDRLMLCSDGLSSVVPCSLIQTTLSSTPTPQQACDELVRLAITHGGPDNITVIVIDVHDERPS